jgi:putative acetyltransferase
VDPRAGVITTHRVAAPEDAQQLFELRRKSIIALAPSGMSRSEAGIWASNLTIAGMETKIREMEIWIAEIDGQIVGWGAIRGDRLEGLYTDPEFAGRGIGTDLLGKLEALMRARGTQTIRAAASSNAEGYYLRPGLRAGRASPRWREADHQAALTGTPLTNSRRAVRRATA